MENWQKSYIVSKLEQLLELTTCNVVLLVKLKAANILSASDVQAIKAEKTELEKADKLYDFIQAKVEGYEVLTKALYQCNQTGALKVLLNGFALQNIKNPLSKCGIEIDRDKLLECKIEFQGKVFDFKNLLESYLDCMELNAFLDGVQQTDYIDLVLLGGKSFVLAQNKIPPALSYYVPRFISNRLKVDPALFKEHCRDIFVFKNVERYELSNIAEPNSTSTSSRQTENISFRFILWECDDDLRDICSMAKQSGTPVHVIRVENELITDEYSTDNESNSNRRDQKCKTVYILEESNGHSDYLWRFVCGKQQCYMSEEEFIDEIEEENFGNSKGFCICDTPGMGKTLLVHAE